MTQNVEVIVQKALRHVREFCPTVVKVTFRADGTWRYKTHANQAPNFPKTEGIVNVGLLEAAMTAVENSSLDFPVTFWAMEL